MSAGTETTTDLRLRVLRVYHSGVVSSWRRREVALRTEHDVRLVAPRAWNEGGSVVRLEAKEPWITPARTFGRHPYVFVYNPWPIARLLWNNSFDLLDIHEEPASIAALELRILARIRHRNVPMLFYGAQNITKKFPFPFRMIERGSLRRASAVYPCNQQAGEILVTKGFDGVVRQLDLGVDVDEFSENGVGTSEVESAMVTIGYVGRLEEHKGVHVAIQALCHLDTTFHLHIVGSGPYEGSLRTLVSSLGLADRVRFLGHVDRQHLPAVYRQFDLAVIPSQTRDNWIEQFGRVAVESMAAGVPLVVSDSGSLPDVVADAALVTPEADAIRWAEAIRLLANDRDQRQLLIERGRQRAAMFTWDRIASQQSQLYRQLVAT